MFDSSVLISLAITLSYTLGIKIIRGMRFKILYSLVFTLILLAYFPIQNELKFHKLFFSSCMTVLVMSGPLLVVFFKYLKFRDFGYFYKPDDIYTFIHCLLTGPICEEIIFRHAIYQMIGNNFIQASIFAIVHFNLKNFASSLLQVGFTFVFGVWAGLVRNNLGIEGCIFSHLICNWIGFPDFEFFLTLDKKVITFVAFLQITCIFGAIKLFS